MKNIIIGFKDSRLSSLLVNPGKLSKFRNWNVELLISLVSSYSQNPNNCFPHCLTYISNRSKILFINYKLDVYNINTGRDNFVQVNENHKERQTKSYLL